MDVDADYQDVGTFARAIVAKRVGLLAGTTTALTLLVAILAQAGVSLPDGASAKALLVVTGVLNALGLIVGVLWAQKDVTPTDPALSPTAADGTPLVHVEVAAAAVIAATTAAVVTVDDPGLIATTDAPDVPVDDADLITVTDPDDTVVVDDPVPVSGPTAPPPAPPYVPDHGTDTPAPVTPGT